MVVKQTITACCIVGCVKKTMNGIPIRMLSFFEDEVYLFLCDIHINEMSENVKMHRDDFKAVGAKNE